MGVAWFDEHGKNSKLKIDAIKKEPCAAYQSPLFASDEVRKKEGDLKMAIREDEAYWRSKSQTQWIQEGDKNTKYFHAQTAKEEAMQ